MGHRLSKIYTKTGDAGTTGLADGSRVDKDDLRVEVFGTLDETNSAIGIVISDQQLSENIKNILTQIQNHLFDLGSEYCLPGYIAINTSHVEFLETSLDQLNESLPMLKEFVLPGGYPSAAHCHLARTICRRAERLAWKLAKQMDLNQEGLKYLNRLSDLLFVMARKINQDNGVAEPLWKHTR